MIKLKLFKTSSEEAINIIAEDEIETLHGAKVLLRPVLHWTNTDHIVYVESYFASVGTTKLLKQIGQSFTCVVKTSIIWFLVQYLYGIELKNICNRTGSSLHYNDGKTALLEFYLMDRDHQYFIVSGSLPSLCISHVRM